MGQLEKMAGLRDIDPLTKCINVAPTSEEFSHFNDMHRVAGGMLAKCLLEGHACPIKFAPSVYKYLLDQSDLVNLRDMESCSTEPAAMRELKVIAMSPTFAEVARNPATGIPGLDFAGFRDLSEIVESGKVTVNDDNKAAYLEARAYDNLVSQRLAGLDAMRSGFDIMDVVLKYMVPQVVLTADDLMIALHG